LIWELGELASVKRADVDQIKAFLTQRSDTFRPPYAHEDVRYERTVAFVGNVNPEKTGYVIVNRDATGGRRWMPVHVAPGFVERDVSTHGLCVDVPALERDGAQLLGEAAARVLGGEEWHPTEAEKALLAPAVDAVSEDPVRDDPWYAPLRKWARARGEKPFAIGEAFAQALDMPDASKHSRGEALRIAHVLRDLGYVCGAPKNGARKWSKAGERE
jgi:predicted P-loop ATPase